MPKRVVVTGIGIVTSIGIGKDEFWGNCIAGRSGISEITSFDASAYDNHRGGEIKNFNPQQFMSEGTINRTGRTSQLAIAAAKLALEDAGINNENYKDEIGVSIGSAGDLDKMEPMVEKLLNKTKINNFEIFSISPDLVPSNTAKEFGFGGPNLNFPNACSASNYTLAYAFDLIRFGRASKMIAGGAECFFKGHFSAFNLLRAMAPDFPRPFDKERKGMMLGEGSAILVLESLADAKSRGAKIYAEILGCGLSCDAYNISAPSLKGEGLSLAMLCALRNSSIHPDEVDYINAHGTGTKEGDTAETMAIKRIFGRKPRVLVSSIKSMIGHAITAASAIEAAACVLAVNNDIAPPTMNIREVDPMVTFDVLANHSKSTVINIAMNNSAAFGGTNAAIIFKKYKG